MIRCYVIPAKAGIQFPFRHATAVFNTGLGSRFRGNDAEGGFFLLNSLLTIVEGDFSDADSWFMRRHHLLCHSRESGNPACCSTNLGRRRG